MKIVTHSGSFHGDEVTACAILKIIAKSNNEEFEIVRTRDRDTIKEAMHDDQTIVLDVGGEYSIEKKNFDHHQRTFEITRLLGIKYSTAGLIWHAYGNSIPGMTKRVWEEIDNTFITPIDAVDNGIDGFESPISRIVSGLNPTWQDQSKETETTAFHTAVMLTEVVLNSRIETAKGYAAAEIHVHSARFMYNGRVLLLDCFVPWQKIVCENDKFETVQFVIFPDKDGEWRIQTVPVAKDSFVSRKQLPEPWGGLRNEEFSKLVDLEDAVFCHSGLFIAGAKSKASVIRLAELATM